MKLDLIKKQNTILITNCLLVLLSLVVIFINSYNQIKNYIEYDQFELLTINNLANFIALIFLYFSVKTLVTFIPRKNTILYGNIKKIKIEKKFPFNIIVLHVETTGHADKFIEIKTFLLDFKNIFNIGDRIYSNKKNTITIKKQTLSCVIKDT